MYVVLYGIGLLVTAAGFLTIGFGIPINAFSLGNTLIVAGTVAVVGGLVLIGLAAAVRQLNRIGQSLASRPQARPAPAAEPSDAPAPGASAPVRIPPTAGRPPVPPAPKPPEATIPRPSEPRPEPRFSGGASPPSGPLDWLRPKSPKEPIPPAEAPVMEVPDEAPLSPRPPQRSAFTPPFPLPPVSEPSAEPKSWSTRDNGDGAPRMEPRSESPAPRTEDQHVDHEPRLPLNERSKDMGRESGRSGSKDSGLFDVVWPDARSKPMTGPAKREPEPAARPREEKRPENPAERPVAILKSGVIDGMAYTLYADGSIEAELPQGTVRFASVDALRAHLEKSS